EVRRLPIRIDETVTEALKLMRATTPATIRIHSDVRAGMALADSTQVHQCLLNLFSNSVQAIGEKPGHLIVTCRPCRVPPDLAAELGTVEPGEYISVAVTDDGPGMDQKTIDRIFDPFFTTKDTGKGTGLGLSIVQGIIAGHGGACRVRSSPGQGSTFELFFP